MTLSYLVSTAGHSRAYNEKYPHDIRSIIQLIDEGAEEFGEEPIVGFAVLNDSEWGCKCFSFKQLLRLSNGSIAALKEIVTPTKDDRSPIVGLLCPSNAEFLITWIALMRLGYGVLFIAPQCSATAIGSLLRSTACVKLLYHPKYMELALAVDPVCEIVEIPIENQEQPLEDIPPISHDLRTSHVFHSSGTSGTPKPIPQTHHGSTRTLPRRALPRYIKAQGSDEPIAEPASFTTTPLFHGGVSDLIRAWMARSMLYLYPSSEVPITTRHLCDAIAACNASQPDLPEERKRRYAVESFLSVPYILTTLCEDEEGVDLLRSMSLVSTGGAPLAKEAGDKMVKEHIRLVSRLGSSECGLQVLLSSIRDFETEQDWDWLRNNSPYSDALKLEPVADRDGLYEMVVGTDWPSKTKTNRGDGSFATGDLYRFHPEKANVWQYAGRGDDVIVMANGEKVSPGLIEESIRKSPLVKEAIVVGSDQPSIGLLVFSDSPRTAVIDAIKPYLDSANRIQPTFAAIYPEMCLVLDGRHDFLRIPKASKGTVQRSLANDVFAAQIASLWNENRASLPKRTKVEMETFVTEIVEEVLGRQLRDESDKATDFFSAGVDSLKATMIRSKIVKNVNTGDKRVPLNIVFERCNLSSLSSYLFDLQDGEPPDVSDQIDIEIMKDWVEKYGTFRDPIDNEFAYGHRKDSKTLLLTGVTGSLGSEFLRIIGENNSYYGRVICLVRAKDDTIARQRLEHVMAAKGISPTMPAEARAADLSRAQLGLKTAIYQDLLRSELTVLHAAWPVFFASGLGSFEDSINGLRKLLDLVNATHSPHSRLVFCSSLASVLNSSPGRRVIESPSSDPRSATSVGYSRSKWVAEQVCLRAHETGTKVYIMRLGQLCGSSLTGHWNETEGWPLLLRTAQTTRCLPSLKEDIAWLPVDIAARAILEIMSANVTSTPLIYHLVHPLHVSWSAVLDGFESSGLVFNRIDPQEWIKRVRNTSEDVVVNPSRKMLFLWEETYGSNTKGPASPIISTSRARSSSPTLASFPPLNSAHFGKTVSAWRRSGFLA